MKKLETERLILKPLSIDDTEVIFNEILNNKDTLYFLDWPYCENMDESKKYVQILIDNANSKKLYIWSLFEKDTNTFIGCVNLCNYDVNKRMAEIEYVAVRSARGKGYVPEANRKVIDYLINECGLYRIEAVCNVENIASSKVLEKSGMKFEGILRGRAINLNEEGNPGDLKMFSIIPKDFNKLSR